MRINFDHRGFKKRKKNCKNKIKEKKKLKKEENGKTTHRSESPFKAESNTSGVLSVPCGNFLDKSTLDFSSENFSSSEST